MPVSGGLHKAGLEAAAEGRQGAGGARDPAGWLGRKAGHVPSPELASVAVTRCWHGRSCSRRTTRNPPARPFSSSPGNRSQKTLKVAAGEAAGEEPLGRVAEVTRLDGSPGPPANYGSHRQVWQAYSFCFRSRVGRVPA